MTGGAIGSASAQQLYTKRRKILSSGAGGRGLHCRDCEVHFIIFTLDSGCGVPMTKRVAIALCFLVKSRSNFATQKQCFQMPSSMRKCLVLFSLNFFPQLIVCGPERISSAPSFQHGYDSVGARSDAKSGSCCQILSFRHVAQGLPEREMVYEIVESYESILKDVTGFIYESILGYVAAVFKVLLCRH